LDPFANDLSMTLTISDEQKAEVLLSLRRYCESKLEYELSNMEANFLLEYIATEIAPIAYNQGVRDATNSFLRAAEDIPGSCFEEPLRYWSKQPSGVQVRRKPGK
jgi:uncharacterized protein (DUF2164 family)